MTPALFKKRGKFLNRVPDAPNEGHADDQPVQEKSKSIATCLVLGRHAKFVHDLGLSPWKWKRSSTGRTETLQINAITSSPDIKYIVGA